MRRFWALDMHSRKEFPEGNPVAGAQTDMGTTQGQRTPDSVGEVAACPRDMCCMGTASGGSTSRPTAAPSASGRLKGPFSVWPPRQILVCHICQAARGQIPSRTSRVARAHCHGNPWPSTVSRSPTVRSCCGSGCSHTLGVLRFYRKWGLTLGLVCVVCGIQVGEGTRVWRKRL